MEKWKINGCPRFGGSIFVDRDMDGWYEQCINCSRRNELKISINSAQNVTIKDNADFILFIWVNVNLNNRQLCNLALSFLIQASLVRPLIMRLTMMEMAM